MCDLEWTAAEEASLLTLSPGSDFLQVRRACACSCARRAEPLVSTGGDARAGLSGRSGVRRAGRRAVWPPRGLWGEGVSPSRGMSSGTSSLAAPRLGAGQKAWRWCCPLVRREPSRGPGGCLPTPICGSQCPGWRPCPALVRASALGQQQGHVLSGCLLMVTILAHC